MRGYQNLQDIHPRVLGVWNPCLEEGTNSAWLPSIGLHNRIPSKILLTVHALVAASAFLIDQAGLGLHTALPFLKSHGNFVGTLAILLFGNFPQALTFPILLPYDARNILCNHICLICFDRTEYLPRKSGEPSG